MRAASSTLLAPLPWRRFATAAVTGGLAVAGLIVALNVPPLGAGLFGLGVGWAALMPLRSARVGALIIGTLMGVMLGLQLALAYQLNVVLIIGAVVGTAVVGSSAWRQATAPEATATDRAVTLLVSLVALFLLLRMLGAIGSEGGHCYVPALPVGCQP